MIAYSFFTILAALTAVYLLFLFRMRSGLHRLEEEQAAFAGHSAADGTDTDSPSVSVLIPARNEEKHIEASLASLRAQDYTDGRLEVLIVDDHSEDGTADLVRREIETDSRFRLLSLPAASNGKKSAITSGVENASGEIIVTTDADCLHDTGWLRAMTAPFRADAEGKAADVVAGPVVYERRDSMFARLQALEFLGLVGVGAGFFGIGYPRLCNGANFAYRKTMFEAVGGYDGNADVHSGDDEFLLHRIVYFEGGRAEFATGSAAVVRTEGAHSIGAFLRQRIRWSSKTGSYEDTRFVSFLVLLFFYLLFAAAAPAVGVTSQAALAAAVLFFGLKVVGDSAVLFPAARLFQQPIRLVDLLAAEVLHPYYIVVVTILGLFGKFRWKNRKLNNRRPHRR